MVHQCCKNKRTRALLLLALARKRRRLGYAASHGCSRLKKLLLLYVMVCSRANNPAHFVKSGRKDRRWWVRPIFADHDKFGAWTTLIPQLRDTDEEMFFNFMRMTPETFDKLLKKVSPFMKKVSWRKSISCGERLAITLRFLATGDSQTSLSYLFRVSNQAISHIVLETTTVIWHVLKQEVFPTPTEDFWLKTAAEFQVMWDIPHCLGAIDGKQVYIKAFAHAGSRWYGWKKRHAMTFMAVSDAKHRFIIVESGASGKRADANIFHKSSFAQRLRTKKLNLPPPVPVDGVDGNMPFFFVGDNAYPQMGNLATPFKGAFLRDEEFVHNYRLSRARRIVENAFGILCARFRIFFRPIEGSPRLVRSIILACLALHNFHLMDEESIPPKRQRYKPYGYADYMRHDGKIIYGRWRNENPAQEQSLFKKLETQVSEEGSATTCKGKALGEMLIRYFVFNPVPWQWEKACLL